jgi:hypothetical protein
MKLQRAICPLSIEFLTAIDFESRSRHIQSTNTMLLASVVLVLAVASPQTGVPAVLITHYSDAQVLFAAPFTPPGPCNALVLRDGLLECNHGACSCCCLAMQ